MLRFDRNTWYAVLLVVWLAVVVIVIEILAPDLSANELTYVAVAITAASVGGVILVARLLGARRAPAPAAVVDTQISHPPDPPFEPPTDSREQQPTGSFAGELERLADMHARGALSDDQFEAAKTRLLRM